MSGRRITPLLLTISSVVLLFLCMGLLCACSGDSAVSTESEGYKAVDGYYQITQAEAKELMDSEKDYIILDVRTEEEYEAGHIENAILIPHTEIGQRAEKELKDKNQLILVYCRSGNRSKTASKILAELGYTNVMEFGGINSWAYGTIK